VSSLLQARAPPKFCCGTQIREGTSAGNEIRLEDLPEAAPEKLETPVAAPVPVPAPSFGFAGAPVGVPINTLQVKRKPAPASSAPLPSTAEAAGPESCEPVEPQAKRVREE
jgi:hypothetical protein